MTERVARFVVEVRAPGEDLETLKARMGAVRKAIIDASTRHSIDLAITGVHFCDKTPLPASRRVRIEIR